MGSTAYALDPYSQKVTPNALPPSAGLEKTDRLFKAGVQVTY
jgi:hypothetical protein